MWELSVNMFPMTVLGDWWQVNIERKKNELFKERQKFIKYLVPNFVTCFLNQIFSPPLMDLRINTKKKQLVTKY